MRIILSPELTRLLEKPANSEQMLAKLWQKAEEELDKKKLEKKQEHELVRVRYSFD